MVDIFKLKHMIVTVQFYFNKIFVQPLNNTRSSAIVLHTKLLSKLSAPLQLLFGDSLYWRE